MKAVAIILGIMIVLGGAFYFLNNTSPTPAPSEPANIPSTIVASYTLAEVATHGTASSCWAAINGKVYNLTAWINQHPGGDKAILSICGKDGSAAFTNQHSGQSKPEEILATFYIGNLK